MAFQKKKAPPFYWLSIPFALLVSIVYTILLFYFIKPSSKHFITDEYKGVEMLCPRGLKYKEVRVSPGEKLRAVFASQFDVIADTENGDRIAIGDFNLMSNLQLPDYNINFSHYVKKRREGGTFVGMHIDEIINEYGDYFLCDKKRGVYEFNHIVAVDDEDKYIGLVVTTDKQGIVSKEEFKDKSWNLYGLLPFYEDIITLNILNVRAFGLNYSDTNFLLSLFIVLLFFAIPATAYIPYKEELGDTRDLPTILVLILSTYTFIVEYIITVSFIELTHSWWLITLPFAILLSFFFWGVQIGNFIDKVSYYCEKCHSKNSHYYEWIVLDEKYHYEYVNHEERRLQGGSIN